MIDQRLPEEAPINTEGQDRSPVRRILSSRLLWTALFVGVVVGLMLLFTGRLSGQVRESQAEFVADNVRRSAVQCYALEGSFPPSIQYLEQNYNLVIDRTHYAVYYESMGANLLPQIRVVVGR
ncbi:MAG: hypothetical protein LBP28_04375 [Coriobacteriales bacterium]|jgi:hypothetical protein|nr:hypothetical protein [Coriobacteriales bacterium]